MVGAVRRWLCWLCGVDRVERVDCVDCAVLALDGRRAVRCGADGGHTARLAALRGQSSAAQRERLTRGVTSVGQTGAGSAAHDYFLGGR